MMNGSRAMQSKDRRGAEQDGRGGGRTFQLRAALSGPEADILAMQHAAGNQTVSELLKGGPENTSSLVQDALRSPGQPLDTTTRTLMESHFGQDFSQVRVHMYGKATESARAIDALAYTVGRDVVFGAKQYAPGSTKGRQLLAHELTHVIQGGKAGSKTPSQSFRVSEPDSLAEVEASAVAEAVSSGRPISPVRPQASPGTIHRQEADEQTTKKENTEEARKREKILDDMTRDMNPSKELRTRMLSAMRAFTLSQLRRMQKAGVRFWGRRGLPPIFKDIVQTEDDLSTPAEYLPQARVIRVGKGKTGQIRHELAHAWDHVRAMSKPKPIRGRKAMEKAVMSPGATWSESSRKRATREPGKGGKSKRVKLTIKAMLERYRERAKLREWTFDGPSTQEGHSKRNPRDFYAEGYSVFHGADTASQMRLRLFAPELYELLKREALKNKQPVPDEAELDRVEKEFGFSK
jgi:hypothetical protein